MGDYKKVLDDFISELIHFIDDQSTSLEGEHVAPEPIEQGSPLHEAEKAVELLYPGQMLPRALRPQWKKLLRLSRESGDDVRRGEDAYFAANELLNWAKSEPANNLTTNDVKIGEPTPFLGLHINLVERIVTRDGQSEKSATFARKGKAWLLFYALFKAGQSGLSRDDLIAEAWRGNSVNPSNLDTQKANAIAVIAPLRITINADNYGVWTIKNV